MRKYIDPTIKITHFCGGRIVTEAVVSYIPQLQDMIDNNPEIHERMESFRELLKYRN